MSAKEIQAEKRAIEQELRPTRTGGIPIVGPIRYPAGPLPWGAGEKSSSPNAACSSGGPTIGGLPPGLRLTPPPVVFENTSPKSQRHRDKEPTHRISKEEFDNVGNGSDIWARLENPIGNPHISDDIFCDECAMKYNKQGKIFCLESHRTKNPTYANRIARGAWNQRVHFGEVLAGYTPEDEFFDALVRHRQSQYDVTIKGEKKRRSDKTTAVYGASKKYFRQIRTVVIIIRGLELVFCPR